MAELVDALDSKSSSARSAGSIPARGTTTKLSPWICWIKLRKSPTSLLSGTPFRSRFGILFRFDHVHRVISKPFLIGTARVVLGHANGIPSEDCHELT